jgi:hypothetical protein
MSFDTLLMEARYGGIMSDSLGVPVRLAREEACLVVGAKAGHTDAVAIELRNYLVGGLYKVLSALRLRRYEEGVVSSFIQAYYCTSITPYRLMLEGMVIEVYNLSGTDGRVLSGGFESLGSHLTL